LHKIPGTIQGQALQTDSNNKVLSGSSGHQGQRWSPVEMPSVALRSPGINLFLMEELVAAMRTNKADTFKRLQAQQQQAQQ
jgi:hypothetical protein